MNEKVLKCKREGASFCEGHQTRSWKFYFTNLKRQVEHEIMHYENDLSVNCKFHCAVYYSGCIAPKHFSTNNFKEAVNWMLERLKKH